MFDVYVVGCGGIGGYLLQLLPQSLVSCMLDLIDDKTPFDDYRLQNIPGRGDTNEPPSSYILQHAQSMQLPLLARRLTLIDADTFDPHNAVRQASGAGSKLAVQMQLFQQSVLYQVWLQGMQLRGIDAYVRPSNIDKIITSMSRDAAGTVESDNPDVVFLAQATNVLDDAVVSNICRHAPVTSWDLRRSDNCIPVVFLCVDNHKTRYEVSRYLEALPSYVIVNGGNSKTAGNVNLQVKLNGHELDPKIYEIYPEIADPNSKRPDEVGCTEVSLHNDQISIVNNVIASYMVLLFRKFVLGELYTKKRGKDEYRRLNEIIIDCDACSMLPRYHEVTNKE